MIRTVALVALAFLLVGCSQFQSREGPFGNPSNTKPPPPPYGSVAPAVASSVQPRIVGNQSPLGIASANPAASIAPALPPTPNDPPLAPPLTNEPFPGSGLQTAAATDAGEMFPPFRRRPEPRPDALPSPFAPKDGTPPPKGAAAPKSDVTVAPSPAAKNLSELKALLAVSNAAWKNVDTYEGILTRREINPKGDLNNEVVFYQYRREPMSVFMRTVGDSGKGREIVYNKQTDKMHVMLGEGDNSFMRAGFVAPPISPDDPRVKAKARYSIREAGINRHVVVLNVVVAKLESGRLPVDAVVFNGEMKRPEYPYPLVCVSHKIRAGDEPYLPNGGTRVHFFDMKKDSPSYGLPVLVFATDVAGKEVEYYLYEKFKCPAGLIDADFDPARLGKRK